MNKKCSFHYLISIAGIFVMLFTSAPAMAEDWTDKVTVHGFMTAAYQKTDQSVATFNGEWAEGGVNSEGTTGGTKYGLNVGAQLGERASFASQLFASRNESYEIGVDWAFIALGLNDNIDLRAGRLKYPGGIVSEYVDVSHAYPWIEPPREMYSEHAGSAHAGHEKFTGLSLVATQVSGDVTYSANLFSGEVVEELIFYSDLSGIALSANWDDKVEVLATVSSSTMHTEGVMPMMDDQDHDITRLGVKVDWNDVIVYSEFADVDMGSFKFGEAKSNYVMLGYRIGNLLPHITVSNLEKSQNANTGMVMMINGEAIALVRPFEQTTTTLGLRWDFMDNLSAKFEVSSIALDSIDESVAGWGLFGDMPDDDSVILYGIAIDAVF